MEPSINGTKIKVYRIAEGAETHGYRNRLADKENSYDLVKVMKIQAVWYSHEELRQLESLDRVQSSGYFIFKNAHISKLDIDPTPNGGNWNRYRFQFNINGFYSDRYLEIVEMRPESPHCGSFKLWYAYFREERPEPNMPSIEAPAEDVTEAFTELGSVVDVVRRYDE